MILNCALLNVLAGLTFGYSANGVNAAADILWRCWYGLDEQNSQDAWLVGMLFSAINLGFIPATMMAGPLADLLGRRRALLVAGFLSSCAVLSGLSTSYTMQLTSRLVTGAGMGMLTSICPVYISEMAPEEYRGSIGSLFQVFSALGIFLGSVVGYLILGANRDLDVAGFCHAFPQADIAAMTLTLVAPGLLFGLSVMSFVLIGLPESTPWLKTQGAKWQNRSPDGETASLIDKPASASAEPPSPLFGWQGLLQAPQAVICGLVMAAAFMLTGINAIMSYAPDFMELVGVKHKMFGTCLLMGWNLLSTLLALVLVDRVNRRALLLPSLLFMAVAVLLLHPLRVILPASLAGVSSFLMLLLFITGFETGPGTLFWVVCSEVLPSQVTALGFSLINAAQCTFSLAVTFLFPVLDELLGTKVFFVFGIPGLLVFAYLLFCLPETRNRSKEDITHDMLQGRWVYFGH
eukprot:EG_transcript_10242